MDNEIALDFIRVIKHNFNTIRKQIDGSFAQLSNDDIHFLIDRESNSIDIIMQHLIGNLKSRFTDFYTTDGEKPDRNRDEEFEVKELTKEQILNEFNSSWLILTKLLDSLSPNDLLKIVTIRNENHTVLEAINRQVAHYSYHAGQIVFIAKHIKMQDWNTLTIPKRRK